MFDIKHHFLYIGNGKIIHYYGYDEETAIIKVDSISIYEKTEDKISKVEYPINFHGLTIERRYSNFIQDTTFVTNK